MSYIKILIHAVWATKDREPYLTSGIKQQVIKHIQNYAPTKSIFIDHINGGVEHLHCLLSLSSDQNIATIINLLKGESSFWINRNNLTKIKFGWQDEYFAVSIGESQVEVIRKYIRDQENHHQKKTFQQEYDEFIAKYKFNL